MARLLQCGKLNIVGGCCGTTPEHIAGIARAASTAVPYHPKAPDTRLHLSGLEPLRHADFFKVGERCNVAGSRNFLKLIQQGEISKAVEIAATQIDNGASILDINMDDGMLDARTEMCRFIARLALDPRTSAVPLMIDSSDFSVITGALELIQGRSIVNSISLKEGEEKFLDRARQIHELGAAVVVMAFDEQGQADTYQRRIEICRRSYDLLTQKAGFRGNEIVFDPNVLTVATGIPDHDNYALDFIRATQWITENLPDATVSGGVSNLSFAFRGNNAVRKAMHALFIDHARRSGLSMAIVNPSAPIAPTSDMPDDLLEAIDDVLLNRRADATGRLTAIASGIKADAPAAGTRQSAAQPTTLASLILNGADEGIEQLLDAELARRESAMDVINGPLMEAMDNVGRLFGEGRIFLPQVVRSAAVMRRAIDYLTPLIEAGSSTTANRPKMVLATVKGDV
ncbi:MAG: dihydropteroate synthase, partial [Muribaculaceae bacterium]|nr:dihydropteroate synthase [Muribaculaceae bacterium]